MIRKTSLFLLLSLSLFAAIAQDAKDSLAKVIALEVCEEFEKKDFSSMSKEELEMEMGMMMMPSLTRHQTELKQAFGISSIADQDGMRMVGVEIGKQLVGVCPSFLKAFAGMAGKEKNKTVSDEKELKGTVVKVVPGDFTHVLLKNKEGKTEKIWVMGYFNGAQMLLDNPLKAAGKKVKVTFKEEEVYNATLKQYVDIKIATGLSSE